MEEKLERTPIKIAIVGPESTGKSTLTQYLAQHYQCLWVPEYARYYCADLKRQYTLQDELNMYYGQVALEDSLMSINKHPLIFCDTTFITIKIWSDYLFGSTPATVLNALQNRTYDYYLLMDIDMPWEDDPLRDFPNEREHFLEVWHHELTQLKATYDLVSGLGEARFQSAIEKVDQFLQSSRF